MKKRIVLVVLMAVALFAFAGCNKVEIKGTGKDVAATKGVAAKLAENQPTPTDIDYSLERFNLIRRAYWVNGQRERALTHPCAIADRPLGYVVLFTESGAVVGRFEVDGKVTSLNSFLTPDSDYFEVVHGGNSTRYNNWIADVDGSYGENDSGIFFFTPDGRYIEWTGTYLYSDIPFVINNPVVIWEAE